jgi:hypothetical protein
VVLSALAEGLDASAAERVFGYRQATITTWLSRAGTTDLGHFSAVSTSTGPSGAVARLLSLCAPTPSAASSARAAARARLHPAGTTPPAAYTGDGSRKNEPTMDVTLYRG